MGTMITAYGSSSAGNAYMVTDGVSGVLLDAGLKGSDLMRSTGFRLSELNAVLVSHEHADHARGVSALARMAVGVYASAPTLNALNIAGHRVHAVKARQQFTVGSWRVLPFDVRHDTGGPLGFLLESAADGSRVVYLTDTAYCPHRFNGLTHILLEANYDERILDRNIASEGLPPMLKKRLIRTHMSIDTAIDFLLSNDLSAVQEIRLIHLSSANSDAEDFKRRVQQATGKPVCIAGERGDPHDQSVIASSEA